MEIKIVGLQRVTLIDFPERIAATVFLAGCNLNCGYCHNRWMIDAGAAPEALSVDDLLAWLETRRGLLDGVCVSGGEPTVSSGLADLLTRIRSLGFAVKLDTNGTRPAILCDLLEAGLVDYVAMDLKAPLDERYAEVVGRHLDTGLVSRSMTILRDWGGEYEFRTTVGPQLDESWLDDIAGVVGPQETWILQVFRSAEGIDTSLAEKAALTEEALEAVAKRLRKTTAGVRVRGVEG